MSQEETEVAKPFEGGIPCFVSIARGTTIGLSIGILFHAIAGGGLRALGRKTLTPALVGKDCP
jgi:hypothetical protein